MRIYLLSPEGVPPNPHLFPMYVDTWKAAGHEIVDRIEDCDVVFVDLHTRIANYNEGDLSYIFRIKKDVCTWDEFDKGGLSNLDWPYPLTRQQEDILYHSGSVKSAHFCRLLNKNNKYPHNIYPYEKPILYEDPMCSASELFYRPIDVCFIANSAPQRQRLRDILLSDGRLKCNIRLGEPKIPFDEWVSEHKKAKMFITWSAGGYTDERVQALFSVSAQIREDSNQLLANDFTHLENCVKLSSEPTKRDIDTLVEIAYDKWRLHEIYTNCYNHMKQHYSKENMANYILETISKHGIQ